MSWTVTKPPMLGATMLKSENGKLNEPCTWIRLPFTWALAGMSTVFVTPWSVRSPWSVTLNGEPAVAFAGRATGWVRLNVEVV